MRHTVRTNPPQKHVLRSESWPWQVCRNARANSASQSEPADQATRAIPSSPSGLSAPSSVSRRRRRRTPSPSFGVITRPSALFEELFCFCAKRLFVNCGAPRKAFRQQRCGIRVVVLWNRSWFSPCVHSSFSTSPARSLIVRYRRIVRIRRRRDQREASKTPVISISRSSGLGRRHFLWRLGMFESPLLSS